MYFFYKNRTLGIILLQISMRLIHAAVVIHYGIIKMVSEKSMYSI